MKQLFLVMTLFFYACGWALADVNSSDSDEKNENSLKYNIVVTATRTEQPTLEIGSTTTLITAEQLEKGGKKTLVEALSTVPGLDVVQNGGPGSTASIFIRGANSEHTMIMIDGIRVNDPISTGRTFDIGHLTLDNVSRIEIVRGPQSTLYGSDAMGGIINIITKRGQDKPSAYISAETGSYDTFRESAGISGRTGRFDYSIGVSRFDTKGISAAAEKYGNTEKDGYGNTSINSRFGFSPKEGLEFNLIARYTNAKSDLDNFEGPGGDDPNYIQDTKFFLLNGYTKLSLLKGKWEQRLNVSFNQIRRNLTNDIDHLNPLDSSLGKYKGHIFKLGWQHHLYLNPSNTITAGIEYERETGDSYYSYESSWGPGESIFPKESAHTTGFYVQDSINLENTFFINFGIRIDDHSRFGTETTYRIAPAVVLKSGTKLRATYGTGFKAPSLYQLYSPATDWGAVGNQYLEPEKSKGWDLGLEQFFFNNRLRFSFTYFRNDFDNLIDYDWMQGYINIAEAKTEGLEIYVFVRPLKNLTFTGSYTYTNTLDKIDNERLLRRPKHKANLAANFRFLKKGNLHLDFIYVGERDDVFPYPTRTVADPYSLFNLATDFRVFRNIEIFGRIDNLLDKDYEEVLGYGTPGRSAYIGIKASY